MARLRLLVFFALTALANAAMAQEAPPEDNSEEARGFFLAGRAAYDAGRFEEALERFETSYELSGRPELLYNIGLAADRARRDARALEAYEGYLEAVPDTENRASVEGRIRSIRMALNRDRVLREQASAANADAAASAQHEEADEGGVASKWWFWTIVGVVAVGAAVTVAVVATSGGTQDPNPGDFGVVLEGLGAR